MAWPASDVGTTNADAGTDSPANARVDFYDLIQKFNLLRNHFTSIWKTITNLNGAYTPSMTPVFSATPSFDATTGNVFEPDVMTANITALTITGAGAGQTINLRFKQDATGGRTCALPAGASVSGSINTAANKVSWLILTLSSRSGVWEGSWLNLP